MKIKISISIEEGLLSWLTSKTETKQFASISHGIEYALYALRASGDVSPALIQEAKIDIDDFVSPTLIQEAKIDIDDLRTRWWTDKNIGLSIAQFGGIDINLNRIIQRHPDLFKTKDECRAWLTNKLKEGP